MASIIRASINLTNIDKSKIVEGKKGKYLPIVVTINDEIDQFCKNTSTLEVTKFKYFLNLIIEHLEKSL